MLGPFHRNPTPVDVQCAGKPEYCCGHFQEDSSLSSGVQSDGLGQVKDSVILIMKNEVMMEVGDIVDLVNK